MKNLIIVLAATLVALAGCSVEAAPAKPPELTAETAESLFIKVLHREHPATALVPDAELIETANLVCDALDGGTTVNQIYLFVYEAGMDAEMGGAMVGAGVAAFCPRHRHLL